MARRMRKIADLFRKKEEPHSARRRSDAIQWLMRAADRRLRDAEDDLANLLDLPNDSERAAVVDELLGVFFRSLSFAFEVDRNASEAKQRKILKAYVKNGDYSPETFDGLDTAAQNRLLAELPEGPLALYLRELSPAEIGEAAAKALVSLGPAKMGRPPQINSLAARMCALGLANTFAKAKGEPKRIVDPLTHAESGEFYEFVGRVVDCLPDRVRSYKSGGLKRHDYLVRLGIEERKAAKKRVKQSGNTALLSYVDERLYLGESGAK